MRTTQHSGRPADGEFASYAADDIAFVEGDDAAGALQTQAEDVIALLGGIPEERANGVTYAAGKWTLKEVVGHMIDDERIFAYRILCVARKEPLSLPGFDEKVYVASSDFEQRTLANLIAEYRTVRAATVSEPRGSCGMALAPPSTLASGGLPMSWDCAVAMSCSISRKCA